MKLKSLLLAVGLLAASGPLAYADMVDRVGSVLDTFKQAPEIAIGELPATCYGRTFQKSGVKNRAVGVFPLINYGVITVSVIGGTGDLATAYDEGGFMGAGAHVRVDRVLKTAFPEIRQFFEGSIPWTSGKAKWEIQLGAGHGWDAKAGESAQILYVGPQIAF